MALVLVLQNDRLLTVATVLSTSSSLQDTSLLSEIKHRFTIMSTPDKCIPWWKNFNEKGTIHYTA